MSGVAVSPDGAVLAVASAANEIELCDVRSGHETRRLSAGPNGGFRLAFSPDGKWLAAAGRLEKVYLWETASGRRVAEFPAQQGWLNHLAFTPDSKILAVAAPTEGWTEFWDTTSHRRIRRLQDPLCASARSIAISADGRYLARGDESGSIPVWEIATGKITQRIPARKCVHVLCYSPDGKILATSENDWGFPFRSRFCLRHAGNGTILREVDVHGSLPLALSFTRDGKTLGSIGSDGVIRLWNVSSGKEVQPLGDPQSCVRVVAVAQDGHTVVSQSHDVRFLDVVTGRERGRLPPNQRNLAVSADGGTAVTYRYEDHSITLWDTQSRRSLRRFVLTPHDAGGKEPWAHSLALSSTGARLAVIGSETVGGKSMPWVRVWEVASGRELPTGDWNGVNPLNFAFSPDGRSVALCGNQFINGDWLSSVTVWDQVHHVRPSFGGPVVHLPGRDWECCLALSPDGHMLATGRGNHLFIWETASGKERLRLDGHTEKVTDVRFSPQGSVLASSALDGIRLWNVHSSRPVDRFTGHRGAINALAFSGDGRTLVSGGDDTTVMVWDVSGFSGTSPQPKSELEREPWNGYWAQIAGADAPQAWRAMRRLIASPERTLSLFQERLQPATAFNSARLRKLLDDLENDRFGVREAASQELIHVGDQVQARLEDAWSEAPEPSERKQRLQQILEEIAVPRGERLQALRAIEILEYIGTPQARRLLERLAKGAAGARFTQEARAAARRLN